MENFSFSYAIFACEYGLTAKSMSAKELSKKPSKSVVATFTSILLRWYGENGRSLPWRDVTDPYPIWLSEVILQQTRIQQGWSYWERFMQRWPTVKQLADATEDEVLRLWQGLGYYSRARHLHAAAKQIVSLGGFPTDYASIRKLQGVGEYTAAAISSFAFGEPVAVVDGNVYRVLSRVFGIDTPINTSEGKKTFAALANQLLPKDKPAAYNQAMMDFGAMQCTPKSPDCETCPILEMCDAYHSHRIDTLPVKLRKMNIKTRYFNYVLLRCEGKIAIRRRPAGDIWQGLWEPFLLETQVKAGVEIVLEHCAGWGTLTLLKEGVKHVLTHRVIFADFYLLEASLPPSLPSDYVWVDLTSYDDYAKPRLIEILMNAM